MKRLASMAAGLAALLLSAMPSQAVTVIGSFGTNPTSADGFFANDPNGPGVGGLFSDAWTFDLTAGTWITVANATNTFAAGGIGGVNYISSFAAAIFQTFDAVIGNGDDALVFGPQFATLNVGNVSQSLNGIGFLNAGSYYLQLAGNAGTSAGYGGNFSVGAVPIPAALPMFGAALGGIVWLKRRKRIVAG